METKDNTKFEYFIDLGKSGALVRNYKGSTHIIDFDKKDMNEIAHLIYLDYDNFSLYGEITVVVNKNMYRNHKTTWFLAQQFGSILQILQQLTLIKVKVLFFNETIVFNWLIEKKGLPKKRYLRKEKKELTCHYMNEKNDNIADALLLKDYYFSNYD